MDKCNQTRRHEKNVHDVDLIVTVQLLDETRAVLSLGKLFDEHGFPYEWVSGKEPRLTKQGNIFMQDVKFRTCGRSWIVEFIFYIAIAGLVKYTDKYIIKSRFGAKWRARNRKLVAESRKGFRKFEWPSARSFRMVGAVHRESRRYRNACTRSRFSRLRFGTSYESGILEAQSLYSLPERHKLWNLQENQDDKSSLQKTHWRSSTSSRKSLVTWQQQIAESSMREVNLETIIDMLSWYKILPLNGLNLVRVKHKLLTRRKRA